MRARIGLLAALALGVGCSFPHDPDTELFSCATTADCGTGDVCVIQKLSGKGICFPTAQCTTQTCDGKDDDCDGVINDVADAGDVCSTALHGPCARGTLECGASALECVPLVEPQTESCDGVTDLDCDGLVGCADPDCNGTHACGNGCICADGGNVETNCADGLDNDGDGLTDCADPDCSGQSCGDGCICLDGRAFETDCGDGIDNNNNGLVDCDDPDCLSLGCGLGGNCGFAGSRVTDAGIADAGSPDAGSLDAGSFDAGSIDAGFADAGFADAGSLDAGFADAGSLDAGFSDAGSLDGGSFDAGVADAGLVDAGPYCTARESICDNGIDDDGDGLIDCLDSDCLGRRCTDGGTCLADGGCL